MVPVAGAWNRLDVGVLHDASALLRARPGALAAYFPEGADAPSLAEGYRLGVTEAREQLTGELAQLATSLHESGSLVRTQPGLGALADTIDGVAAIVDAGSGHVATNQIHAHARDLQGTLNDASRIADSLDVLARRGALPADRATTRARMLELASRPFGHQGPAELHELAVLGDDLPAELAIPSPARASWDTPLRSHLRGSTDPEYAASLRAIQVATVAELHSRAAYTDVGAAVARIDALVERADELDVQDAVELYGLLRRTDVRRSIGTYPMQRDTDEIGAALGFLDAPGTEMEQARLAHFLGHLATVRLASTPEQALQVAHAALRVTRSDLDGMSAGRIDGLLDLADDLRPLQDRLFVPVEVTGRLLRGVGGSEPLWTKPNTDRAWVEATLDSALLGMRAEVELARSGALEIEASTAPARLAEVARGAMGATEVLEAQFLSTRLGDGVLEAAGGSESGRVALGLRLATAELLQFGNEVQRLPIIRGYLAATLEPLANLERGAAGRPNEVAAIGQLRGLVERNLARLDSSGPTDGYLRHPDAAEVGRASQLAQLLDRIGASRGTVAEGTGLLTW